MLCTETRAEPRGKAGLRARELRGDTVGRTARGLSMRVYVARSTVQSQPFHSHSDRTPTWSRYPQWGSGRHLDRSFKHRGYVNFRSGRRLGIHHILRLINIASRWCATGVSQESRDHMYRIQRACAKLTAPHAQLEPCVHRGQPRSADSQFEFMNSEHCYM
jgi:hypothetical protein